MTDREVPRRIQRYARRAGLPVDVVAKLAGHSLRAGFVTAALRNGADVFKVMDVTRHVSVETVREYNRDPQRFRGHAGEGLL